MFYVGQFALQIIIYNYFILFFKYIHIHSFYVLHQHLHSTLHL